MRVDGDWDRDRAAEFLTERTIPVRVSCRTPGGGLWMLSLWYRYRDGGFQCATGAGADVVAYLREDPSLAFEVSTNRPPYMGDLVDRYLGDLDSSFARWLLSDERDEVAITVDVDRIYSWDFSDRMPADDRD